MLPPFNNSGKRCGEFRPSHQPAATFSSRSSVSGPAHQQNQRCRLRIRLSPLLLPFLQRPFVDPQRHAQAPPLNTTSSSTCCPHSEVESGRLALPDVLPAWARNRLRGIFLCHRLPADGTIFAPHIGPAFLSTNRLRAGGHVKLIDHGVKLFLPLQCCEQRERFPVGGNRSG